MKISLLDSDLELQYREFLLEREHSLFYCSLEYRDLLTQLLGANANYLVAMDDDRICGVLPTMSISNSQFGTILNSLPYYGSNGGVISDGRPETNEALLDAYLALERDLGCAASTLIGSPFDSDRDGEIYERALSSTFRDYRIGQITTLPLRSESLEEDLFTLYDDTARRNVRKARKSGIACRADGSRGAIDFLFETHVQNMRSIGGLSKGRSFFDAVSEKMPPACWRLYLADVEGKSAAAMLTFRFNRTIEYYTPVIADEFRSLQPLALLVHEAMVESAKEGFHWWNWGGTWQSQVGVHRFKRKWGAKDMKYHYYTRISDRRLIDCTREQLLNAYPGFFVLPFDKLAVHARGAM